MGDPPRPKTDPKIQLGAEPASGSQALNNRVGFFKHFLARTPVVGGNPERVE